MEAEEILNISAKNNMLDWDIKKFKKTHPHLLKTILHAINLAKNKTDIDYFKSEATNLLKSILEERKEIICMQTYLRNDCVDTQAIKNIFKNKGIKPKPEF